MARAIELGVVSQGKTVEEAEMNLREAVELYLEDVEPEKELLPKHAPIITSLEVEYA